MRSLARRARGYGSGSGGRAGRARRRFLTSERAGRDGDWWRARLDGLVASGGEAFDELPPDHRRAAGAAERPAQLILERLEGNVAAALARLARSQRVERHALLLALLAAEVRRRTGRSCVIVGSHDGPHPPGPDGAAHLLPVILSGGAAQPVAALLQAARATLAEAEEHGGVPAALLHREMCSRRPESASAGPASLGRSERGAGRPGTGIGPFDVCLMAGAARSLVGFGAGLALAFGHERRGGDLELSLAWDPDRFRRSTAEAWLRSLAAWARWLAEDPGRVGGPLPPLLPEEERRLAEWERGSSRPRPPLCFHELFERVADAQPDRPAVVTQAGIESYAELEQEANRVARHLRDHGVGREEPVAVLTECSPRLPAVILGIWKAGAAYLPLALEQPQDRLAHMARDAGARTLVVLDGHAVPAALADAVQAVLRPPDWERGADVGRPAGESDPRDLAYIIYTSGTSGPPKGVLIQHDSLVNSILMTGEACGLNSEDRVSLVATPGFDASLWELGLALLQGMALVPVPRALRDDPWALKRWYGARGVTVAFHTPSYLRLAPGTPFGGLRVLMTGGEAPTHDDARRLAGSLALWNFYGPTETCIVVSAERLTDHPVEDRPLAVGRPLANTRVSIRRKGGELVPPGVVGEVWLGGVGLSRGYLNNPELTRQRFVDTPDGRFYRSGDLGRWTEDGRLELAGRMDDQIKLHGQRVELGEIEQALRCHPSVEEVVVLVDAAAQGTKVLRAFVRLSSGAAAPEDGTWRAHLADRLPAHMVPASVTALAAIPLTAAGKVDREALLSTPRPQGVGPAGTPPRGELETRIAALWKDLLQDPGTAISREDDFFALGGNSLLAVTMAHRLALDLGRPVAARELFAAPTLAGFAERLEAPVDALAPAPATSDLATEGQGEFRVAEAAGLDTRTFNIPLLLAVEGAMPSRDRWNEAWAALVERHEALRTSFHEDAEGRLRFAVTPASRPALESSIQPDRTTARAFVREQQSQPFHMGVSPLWRAGLVEVKDSGEHLFWLALHHSVGDGRSLAILVEELEALLRGEPLAPSACAFGESAGREEDYLAGPACAADARYWRDLLLGLPGEVFAEGPLEFPRSVADRAGTHRLETRLDAATARGLRAVARQHQASLQAVMLTLLALEAGRRTGREQVLVGVTASTRETAGEANVVGYYVNMLPVPCRLPRGGSFGAALRETQASLSGVLQHARYPFARMYHDFWGERPQHHHPARYPLFDLAVTESPAPGTSGKFPRLAPVAAPAYELTGTSPGEDMVLVHEAQPDGSLLLQWQVNAALYGLETARSWFEALLGWAGWLAEQPARAGSTIPVLLPAEAVRLAAWEQGATIVRPALRFHELFEQVLDRPGQRDRPAVITRAGILGYGALEEEANALAHGLLRRGARPGSVVGVLTGRSPGLPAALLAIWKAGATYLPLSADQPEERQAFMARDAGMADLIALDGLPVPPALPPALRPEDLDASFRRAHRHRPAPAGAAEVAYIIYTSGSTGEPKGTAIGHEAFLNSMLGCGEAYGLNPDDRSLMFASPSFDVSLSDMGLPLAFGAALCPVPEDVLQSPGRFRNFLSDLQVTVADLSPGYLRLLEGAPLPSLRILVTGGEAPFAADVEAHAGRLGYFNAYGPTENAITSTLGRLLPGDRGTLPAGRPLPNTCVEVCDAEGDRVPPGVVGEIWLGGAGLARGYLGRPELTAAAFRDTARGRRYRSGDLGRWRASGVIEVLGRMDQQVKLNGVRIELGEIEHALERHPDVAQAVAVLDHEGTGHDSLWAFVRPCPGGRPPEDGWREYLADRLPAVMLPSAVITVERIPLTAAGKVDRAALKRLRTGRAPRGEEAEPHAGLEEQIARVWSDLLGVGSIHRDDDFFSLGGHSLLAIAVAQRLEQSLGYPVSARELFAEPTLGGFARAVRRSGEPAAQAQAWKDEVPSDRATEAQRQFWVAAQAGLDPRGFTVPLTLVRRGEIPSDEGWRAAWGVLVARHEALRTGFYEDGDGLLRCSVLAHLDAPLEVVALPDLPSALAHAAGRQVDAFAMEHPPLWRAGLVRVLAADQAVSWLALHHAVADGVSVGVLAEELATLLDGGTLPPLPGRLDLSAGKEERYLAGSACQADRLYWRGMLESLGDSGGNRQALEEWPLDHPRPPLRRARHGGSHSFRVRLDAAVTAGLRGLAQRNGASLHAVMLTIMAREVYRRTGRSEFLIGTAASTRDCAGEARIVGCYVNLLPLPCRVRSGEPVEGALRAMQRSLAGALHHARYPFARICADFREARPGARQRQDHAAPQHPARHPLFDLAVTESPGTTIPGFTGVDRADGYALCPNAPNQDMVLVHEANPDGGLCLQWYVDAGIYEQDTAEAWFDSLVGWARFLAGECLPGAPWPALLPKEQRTLSGWEHGPIVPLPAPSFPAWFERVARRQPDRPALITERGALSYAELDARSTALADALLEGGLARQEVVGVLTERSSGLPEAVLAIWKAGGCYLPLVRDLPAERLAFMARDAGIRVLLVLDALEAPAALAGMGCPVVRPEPLWEKRLVGRDRVGAGVEGLGGSELAYVIYTSGSTGNPKGVVLHHQGLNNLAMGTVAALDMRPGDRVAMMASPAFDAWIAELVMAWAAGAALVPILRGDLDDPTELRAKFDRLGVTVVTMPPSYLRLMGREELPSLRLLMTAGEPPNRADALYYAERLRYMNGYGPTENTVAACYGQVTAGARRLAAGKPLANTSIHLRTIDGVPVPPGAVGVIWLGGAQLAAGYLNRPELTAASFVEGAAGRLYCTGDLGRWTRAGELEVLGRSDGQVKVRGQRVELGEIEHRLGEYPGVRQAVVAVETGPGDERSLWAFVCMLPDVPEPTPAAWRDHLSATLPTWMLPRAVIRVPLIPVTTAGKVDRAALLRSAVERGVLPSEGEDRAGTPPREGVEQRVAQVWAEHLECRGIVREDDFFDLGGNSLRAIAVVNHLRRTLQCTVNDLYEHPHLADFAATCRQRPAVLRTLIHSAHRHWDDYQRGLCAYEEERAAALAPALRAYEARNQPYRHLVSEARRDYRQVLLTGATGYLGSQLLRELLARPDRQVSALVRGEDDRAARARLGEILCHAFGTEQGARLRDDPRLEVLAGDLRRDDLGLPSRVRDRLADGLRAIFHCAANVKHFGHRWEFQADNVAATGRLLDLAAHHGADPADFHLVSTLSVCGKAAADGFRLFTEYDAAPAVPDDNYYVRSKQEAERLVTAARQQLANTCIHRVGNLVFAAGGGPLQRDLRDNAFFRKVAAFLCLGAVPDDVHVWLCHVDVVARGVVLLADAAELTNETHHLENARQDTMAGLVAAAGSVRACSFGAFLERLEQAVDQPGLEAALAELLEAFGLYDGISPQARSRRLEIVSGRTQLLLARAGLGWPPMPEAGQAEMLRQAARLFGG